MDIISNIKLRKNEITLGNSGDYIRKYLSEYFGYQYDSDVIVNLYVLLDPSSEYNMFERYREMLEDHPNINSGYLRYIQLTENRSTYGRVHSMAKNILYQGWRELGCYFTFECKERFKQVNKYAFDLIMARLSNGLSVSEYRVTFRPIIEYIELTKEKININSYSFFGGISRQTWFALENVDVKEFNGKYKVRVYSPKTRVSKSIQFKSYTNSFVPSGNFYKLEAVGRGIEVPGTSPSL